MFKSPFITTVDTHTQGEPTRVVTGGVGPIPGSDMSAKKKWFAGNRDHIRRFLLWEPRGHQDMFGVIVTEPTSPEAEAGLLFMDSGGYLDMCGHGSMGAVVALIETGRIPIDDWDEDSTRSITVDTPSGQVMVKAAIANGCCEQVTLMMPPAFWHSKVSISLEGRSVPVNIVYAGNFFGLVDANEAKLPLNESKLEDLKKAALSLRREINSRFRFAYPVTGDKAEVALIEFYEQGQPARNVVIFGSGQVDRSPCGTGTCAKMAFLHKHGRLEAGREYIHQGILGTRFTGRIVREATCGTWQGIIPEVSGRAFVTGFHNFLAQPRDPFEFGFQLPD